jgi:hypothetical protein
MSAWGKRRPIRNSAQRRRFIQPCGKRDLVAGQQRVDHPLPLRLGLRSQVIPQPRVGQRS